MKTLLFFTMMCGIASPGFSQNIGIGTTTPTAKLEIKSDGNTSTTNALMIKNSLGDTMLRLRNNGRLSLGYNGSSAGRTFQLGGNGINFFQNDSSFGGAIWPTDTSLVIWSGNADVEKNYVILQPSWGKVGIGTFSPDALLHVDGPVILGTEGTVLTRVIKVAATRDLPSIAPNTSLVQTFTVQGVNSNSTAYISPSIALADGLLIAYCRVSTANTVEVKFMNVTGALINHGIANFYITVVE